MGRTDELEASRGTGRGATLEDVARVAGVSRATVSRVVRGDVQVRRDKVVKVESAVQELGYVPNNAARSLASRQSGAVADRKSTRLNSSHVAISYAVFCLKKKTVKLARQH